ncbi:MAG: class I SAM-dependent methyltransferase [Myxococcaceae bacterium]
MTARPCPICKVELVAYSRPWLLHCERCGLLASTLAADIPTAAQESVIDEDSRDAALAAVRNKNNALILDSLAKLHPTAKKVLDVGCGPGHFLKLARERGFQCTGIEPDANVIERARRNSGVDVRHGFFPAALQPDDAFDVITLHDVFEHLTDPAQVLEQCRTRLNPGGVLILNCPSKNGVFYRLGTLVDRVGVSGPLERLWQKGLVSPHLWYFSPELLEKLGAEAGFTPVANQELLPIALEGLWQRVSFIRGQSLPSRVATFAASAALYPLLSVLPRDIGVVFLRAAAQPANLRAAS